MTERPSFDLLVKQMQGPNKVGRQEVLLARDFVHHSCNRITDLTVLRDLFVDVIPFASGICGWHILDRPGSVQGDEVRQIDCFVCT